MVKFRLLRADEVDARVSTVNEKGLSLLLYKDARCDMNILDETIGCENWQRKHELINGNLFCSVGIYRSDTAEWIWKQDVGTESYTEKEKGQASDSFKRACFNLGIGRELYTAPFMWVPANKCNIKPRGENYTCYDRFTVTRLEYDDRKICYVEVYNRNTQELISFGRTKAQADTAAQVIGAERAAALKKLLDGKGVTPDTIFAQYKVNRLEDLTEEQHSSVVRRLAKSGSNGKNS